MDAQELQNCEAQRPPGEGVVRGERSLPDLCAAAVALCSFYYVRLMKERRRRECERRRRIFRFRHMRAREQLRFAVLWTSQVLSRREVSAISCAPECPGGGVCAQASALWTTVMEKAFTNSDWIESFRMTKSTFGYLCDQLRPVIEKMDSLPRQVIPAEMRLAMTLLRLGSLYEFRTIEKIFGVSRSSLREVVADVCEAVVSVLTPRFITVPRGDALQDTMRDFEQRFGLPQLAGVIGTFHVAIHPPQEGAGPYYNTKGWQSMVLQAVVDSDRCFWDLNVGSPGNVSDGQALLTSELYEWGTEGSLFPKTSYYADGMQIPVHLLGSRSYPLLPWLMTPFFEDSSPERTELNRQFSSALGVTRVAFGRLKGRWSYLLKRSDADLSFLPTLIVACCTLHNICESRGDPFLERWLEEAAEEELEQPSECEEEEEEPQQISLEIRNALANTVWAQNSGV